MNTSLDVENTLNMLHDDFTWRGIAELDEYTPMPAGTLCAIAKGYPVPLKWRDHLGLAPRGLINIIIGEVPAGSQSIGALYCQCGRWFIPNTNRRRQCFICGPYRKRKR